MIRENKVRKALKSGKPMIGTFVKIYDPAVVEVLGLSEFDFFVLDTEHSAVGRESMVNLIRAADLHDMVPIIRVRENRPSEILQVLDSGAMGILVPQVNNREEVLAATDAAKYAPEGKRGFAPTQRGAGYGFIPPDRYPAMANENILVACYCETKNAVDNIDEILTVPELDVVFIGPMDLSQSLGITAQTKHPLLVNAVDTVTRKTVSAGKTIGTIAADANEAYALVQKGYRFITISADLSMIASFGKKTVTEMKDRLGR